MLPSEAREQRGRRERAVELRGPVDEPRGQGKCRVSANANVTARVEVRAGDVADGVDHRHDHEAEGDRNADVAEGVRLGVDHDRARAREDERERADRLGDERARVSERCGHALGQERSERRERLRHDPVVGPAAALVALDESGLAQHT